MNWFNNLSLKYKFGGFNAAVILLALTLGAMLVSSINSIQALTNSINSNNTNSLYTKELQINLIRINAAFSNLADIEEGVEDAQTQLEAAQQNIDLLIKESMKSNSLTIPTDEIKAYKEHFKSYFENGKQTATAFMSQQDGDEEDYVDDINNLTNKILIETEALISRYLEATKQHHARTLADLHTTRNESLILLLILLAVIIACSLVLLRSIHKPIQEFIRLISDMTSEGWNLTMRFDTNRKDEFGELAAFFNNFISTLRNIINNVTTASGDLNVAAQEVAQTTRQTNNASIEQCDKTERIATAVTQISATVNEVANNTADAAKAAHDAAEESTKGRTIVFETIQSIENVDAEVGKALDAIVQSKQDSDSIGAIVDVINNIAEQTNLLALNAAIEAARAGDHGRGFAVVADEVRTLATRTKQSTGEIQQMVERLQSSAERAMNVMEESTNRVKNSVATAGSAGASLETITKSIDNINTLNTQIASATEEQLSVFENINEHIHDIHMTAEHMEDNARQSESASQRLNKVSSNLQSVIGQFHV